MNLTKSPRVPSVSSFEAATMIGQHVGTIRRLCRENVLVSVKIGKARRISIESIETLLREGSAFVKEQLRTCLVDMAGQQMRASQPRPATTSPSADPVAPLPVMPSSEQIKPSAPPAEPSPFSQRDLVWISKYRNELLSDDPAVREAAKYHLSMFRLSAAREAAWKDPKTWPVPDYPIRAFH